MNEVDDLKARLEANRTAVEYLRRAKLDLEAEVAALAAVVSSYQERNAKLRDQVGRLAGALVGATVSFDKLPNRAPSYMDRLLTGWSSGTVVLDAQAVDDIADTPWWSEAATWHSVVEENEQLRAKVRDNDDFMVFMKEWFDKQPCMHGPGPHDSTPPMFWPELIIDIWQKRTEEFHAHWKAVGEENTQLKARIAELEGKDAQPDSKDAGATEG